MGKDAFSFPMGRKKTPFQVRAILADDRLC